MNELQQSLRSCSSGNVVFGQLNKDILSEFSEAKLLVRICSSVPSSDKDGLVSDIILWFQYIQFGSILKKKMCEITMYSLTEMRDGQ